MTRYFKILVWPIALVPLVYLAVAWPSLPERVALHFDLEGKADRFGNKSELVIMIIVLSLMSAGVYFLMANIYKIDPKRYAADNKDKLRRMGFAISIFVSAVACFIIYSTGKGSIEFGMRYIFAGVGLLLCLMGNYMHTIKPNYFAGLRLPWTLNNEENWRRTHLMAGKLWFAGGLILAVLCVVLPDNLAVILFFVGLLILVFIPVVYSFKLYKAGKDVEEK